MEETIQQQQNPQPQFKCTGDCMTCRETPEKRMAQWRYCAAQHTYNSMRMIGDMQAALRSMQGTVDELKAKIEAIQSSEACVLDQHRPDSGQVIQPTAQGGDGA